MSDSKLHQADSEILDADEATVAAMLGNLKVVAAPEDFEQVLRARLADGKSKSSERRAFFPVLRYAVPLGIVLLAGGAYMLNDAYTLRADNVPMVTERASADSSINDTVVSRESEIIAQAQGEPKPEQSGLASGRNYKNVEEAARKPTVSAVAARRSTKTAGGSVDKALIGPGKTILPRGLNPKNIDTNEKPAGFNNTRMFTVKDVLLQIGIDAALDDGSWNVRSVTKNSVAERAGVKAGDVMDAIGDRSLNEKTAFTGRFNAKTLTVKRDGKSVQIPLKVQK